MWQVGASKRPLISAGAQIETVQAVEDLANYYGIHTYELSGMANKMNLQYPGKTWLKSLIKEYSVNFSWHGEFFSSVMSNVEKSYDNADDKFIYSMENSLRFAKEFNCPVVLHPGGNYSKNPEYQLNHCITNLDQAISNVDIDPSLIYIETMGKTQQFGSLTECIKISAALNTRICVDFAHLYSRYMASYGQFTEKMVNEVLEVMDLMGFGNECYFHISGIEWNSKGEVKHLPFHESDFPYKMVCAAIKNSGLSGRIVVECDGDTCNGTRVIKEEMGGG
jgi:endonuclease IV